MNLFHILLLAFIAVPLAEIFVLLEVGAVIGLWPTVGLVLATAVLGAALVRAQGLATLARVQGELARGEPPAMALIEGALIVLAGALLLTPGFLTDTFGFLCLTPPVRAAIAGRVIRSAVVRAAGVPGAAPQAPPGVIDGEFTRDASHRER